MAPDPQSSKKMFDTLQSWCDSHDVSIIVDSTIGIGAHFSSEDENGLFLSVRSRQDEPTMLHETAHAYVHSQTKAGLLSAGQVAELDAVVKSIREAEPNLGAEAKNALTRIFGTASAYVDQFLGPTPSDYSFIGNLVDESRTTRTASSDREGHPMDNFDEFCASLSATAAYGEFGSFSKKLQEFEKAALNNPELAPLYNQARVLLQAALPVVSGYAAQLRTANGFGPEPPELMNMELSLAKMSRQVQDLAIVQVPSAEPSIGTMAKR